MTKIRVLSTVETALRASQHILISCNEVGLVCTTGHNGQVSLIAVGTANGDVFIFDVKGSRDVLFDGGVCRILQSPDLLKVMHNCLDSIAVLHRQHGILTQNVFDTQLAFSVVLESEELPPRKLPLASLCEKACFPKHRPSSALQTLLREDADVWMRRPLTKDTMATLTSSVTPLYPLLHKNLTRVLQERGQLKRFEEMNRDEIKKKLQPGKVQIQQSREKSDSEGEWNNKKYRNKNTKLSNQQRLMLTGMMPVIIKDI